MIKPLLAGLKTTLCNFFRKSITLRYPEEKWSPPERFRGQPVLISNDEGEPRCVACGLCEKICPCACITVVPVTGEDGRRRLKGYTLDLLRCCFCGLCVESCPMAAIKMSNRYELANCNKDVFILHEQDLLEKTGTAGDVLGQ